MKAPKNISSLLKVLLCGILAMLSVQLQAQSGKFPVSGTVVDAQGEPVIGATVKDNSTNEGVVTDIDGKYRISVTAGSELSSSCVGFEETKVKVVAGKKVYDITLKETNIALEEVVVVGYGAQKKATLSGAVSAVSGKEIVTTKNEDVQNMLTGKIPGLRVRQNSSEPGTFNTSLDIRGFGAPLVVIDGVPRDNISRIDPEDIESISVLKDASAAIYGVKVLSSSPPRKANRARQASATPAK